jgi:hypothetical protein
MGKSIPQVPNNAFRLGAVGRSDGIVRLSCARGWGGPDWSPGVRSSNGADLAGSLRWSVFVRVMSAMTPPAERKSNKAPPTDPGSAGGARNHGARQHMVSTGMEVASLLPGTDLLCSIQNAGRTKRPSSAGSPAPTTSSDRQLAAGLVDRVSLVALAGHDRRRGLGLASGGDVTIALDRRGGEDGDQPSSGPVVAVGLLPMRCLPGPGDRRSQPC